MRRIDVSFQELIDFLNAYKHPTVVETDRLHSDIKSAYRRYRSLLVWHWYLSHTGMWAEDNIARIPIINLFTECVSDAAQSILLASQGLYKPAHLVLRSAIENYFKCVGIAHGVDLSNVTNVFNLIDQVKETDVVKSTASGSLHFGWLRYEYANLCKHVHTADEKHMSGTNYLGAFPRYDRAAAAEFFSRLTKVAISITAMNCLMFVKLFRRMHHTNYDQISDMLPKATKVEIAVL